MDTEHMCCNTIPPVENAGRWGACRLRTGHYGDCIEVSGRDSTRLLAYERSKQIMKHHYIATHDDESPNADSLIAAAFSYAQHAYYGSNGVVFNSLRSAVAPEDWPWPSSTWHPEETQKANLIKAGALILAALDYITREEERNAAR